MSINFYHVFTFRHERSSPGIRQSVIIDSTSCIKGSIIYFTFQAVILCFVKRKAHMLTSYLSQIASNFHKVSAPGTFTKLNYVSKIFNTFNNVKSFLQNHL